MKRIWKYLTNKISLSIEFRIQSLSPILGSPYKKGTSEHVMWAKEKRDDAQRVLDQAKQDFKSR